MDNYSKNKSEIPEFAGCNSTVAMFLNKTLGDYMTFFIKGNSFCKRNKKSNVIISLCSRVLLQRYGLFDLNIKSSNFNTF